MKVFSKFISLLIVCCITIPLILSCNQRKKQGDGESSESYEDHLIVAVEVMVLKDDYFELYYRNKDEQFNAENSIRVEIKGSEEFQTLLFVLDHHIFPSHIRLDLGMKEDQDPIALGQLAFRYNDAVHEFTKAELQKYFRPNKGLEFDFDTLTARGVPIDGKYDPYLVSYDISYFVNKLILF